MRTYSPNVGGVRGEQETTRNAPNSYPDIYLSTVEGPLVSMIPRNKEMKNPTRQLRLIGLACAGYIGSLPVAYFGVFRSSPAIFEACLDARGEHYRTRAKPGPQDTPV